VSPRNFYTLTPLSGDREKQLVLGYRDAMSLARDIAARGHTVIVRNERDMLSWTVEPIPGESER
jgi:hypothetical protein